jgi:putative flippase GtrA
MNSAFTFLATHRRSPFLNCFLVLALHFSGGMSDRQIMQYHFPVVASPPKPLVHRTKTALRECESSSLAASLEIE